MQGGVSGGRTLHARNGRDAVVCPRAELAPALGLRASVAAYGTEGQRFESSRARYVSDAGSPVLARDCRVRCGLGEPLGVTTGVTMAGFA
jgi:hypothetical protein